MRGGLAARAAVTGMAGIFGLTYSLTASVIALVLTAKGQSAFAVGLNAAMHAVGVLIAAPILPRLSARFGGRRVVLVALGTTTIVLAILMAGAPVPLYFPLRVLLGMGAEALFVLSETWTTELSTERDRGRAMAVYMTVMSLGFAAGPAIVSFVGSDGVLAYGIGVACTLLTMAVACVPGLPRLQAEGEVSENPLRSLRLAPLGVGSAALNAAIEAAGLSFLPLYAMAHGWHEEGAAQLIATLMIGAIALQLPIGWLADRMRRRSLVVWLALLAGGSALLWPAVLPYPAIAYPMLFVWGGLFVGIYTTLLAILGDRFGGAELVGVYAVMGLAWGVGALLGPLLVGAAAALTPHALPLVAGAACLLFACFAARLRDA